MLEADLRASLAAVRGPAPRILRADELPSEADLAITQHQLCLLVYRPESRQLSEAELDYFFGAKP